MLEGQVPEKIAKGKKKKSKSKKKNATKKRNYNEIIEQNKRLNTNENNSDNIKGSIISNFPRLKKDNDYANNINPSKIKQDIQLPPEYNVDKLIYKA